MASIGLMNEMEVVKKVEFGVYLDGGPHGEILMPQRYVPENCQIGDTVNVFIYLDSEDRLVATTDLPVAMVGEFARLKVVSVTSISAFLDWGLNRYDARQQSFYGNYIYQSMIGSSSHQFKTGIGFQS